LDLRSQQSGSQVAEDHNMRFEKLLLSVDEAVIDAGLKTDQQRLLEKSEQNDSRRLLLVVEELANKKKEVAASAEKAYLEQVEADFHQSLMADLDLEFKDTAMIMEKVLKLDRSVGKLLDVLYTEACSISRIMACLETLPWLEEAILKFVKQPKYKRADSAGHPITLKTIRSALSFVGIESLRILIPVLIAKHINPAPSEFTPNIVKTMWIYTLGTGNIAKAMSGKYGVKPHFGYNIGLFSNIGRCAVVNLYLRTFDKKLREEIIKERAKNNINQAKALNTLLPAKKYIIALWKRHANLITANVLKSLDCRWLMIANGAEDFAKIRQLDITHVEKLDLHPLAKLLFTSQGFMQYKILQKEQLIGKQEAMTYLRNFGLTTGHVTLISKLNLTGVELNIAGIIDQTVEGARQ
jgi:hypothetical protein